MPLYKLSVDSSGTADAPKKSGVTTAQTLPERTKKLATVFVKWDQEDLNKKLIKDEMLAVSNAPVEIPTSRRAPHGWGLGKVHPKCT